MKAKLLIATVLYLLFAFVGLAQQIPPSEQEFHEQMAKRFKSPVGQLSQKAGDIARVRIYWDGPGADRWAYGLLFIPELIGHFKKSATLVLSWMSIPSIIRHGQGSDLLYL